MRTAEQELAAARECGDAYWIHYWESVIRIVDQAPEFTPTLRAQLSVLLRPAPIAPVRTLPKQRTQKTRTAPVGTSAAA